VPEEELLEEVLVAPLEVELVLDVRSPPAPAPAFVGAGVLLEQEKAASALAVSVRRAHRREFMAPR
jgi:hypothetical protein